MSVVARCHCGAMRLTLAQAPETVTDCTCSICWRYGVLWAYYDPAEVQIDALAATQTYSWGEHSLAFHRCATCGCVTHWAPVHSREPGRMGVNARLLDLAILAKARVRHLDGAVTEQYLD